MTVCFRRLAALLLVVAVLPSVAGAQSPIDRPNPRQRAVDAAKPATAAKLDDALKKWNSTDRTERLEGVDNLGTIRDEAKATQTLVEGVTDPDHAVAVKVIDTLGMLRSTEATTILVQQLLLRDTPPSMKQHILAALGQIGDNRATSAVVDMLVRTPDGPLRGSAIFALGEIGDQAALKPLEQLAKDSTDDTLRRLASEATQKIKDHPQPSEQPPSLANDLRKQKTAPGR